MAVAKNSGMDAVIAFTASIALIGELIFFFKTGCVMGPRGTPIMCGELAPFSFVVMVGFCGFFPGNFIYRWYKNRV
ncbi:hypothetical protein [Bdellovibrio bacteriovorus]|uniref:hypothetical protein n=1 Tax=Bdellovibrio bacteriovorus TaxID=959 RepID=UPI0035A743F2